MNPIIDTIEAGHVASFQSKQSMEPGNCKICQELWPCTPIKQARADHRHVMRKICPVVKCKCHKVHLSVA